MHNNERIQVLLRAIVNGENVNLCLEKLIEDSVSELEEGLNLLEIEEKRHLVRFCFGLFEVKSTSTSFHESRMLLLSVIIRTLNLKQLFEFEFKEFNISRHLIHVVNISALEIKMYFEAQLVDNEKDKREYDECNVKILMTSFEIVDCLISGFSNDETIEYLETSNKVTGIYIVELVDSLRDIVSHCLEFVLEIEDEIKKGLIENKSIKGEQVGSISRLDISEESLRISSLYWIIYYCNLISSKWQIIEPNHELHKYIKLLEIVSTYLNPLHFASSFPTLVHISVLDWGNANGILESIVTSLLSFCSLIGEKESEFRVLGSFKSSKTGDYSKINGLYSGLYHASLLITSAWWSPGIDTYKHVKKGEVKNVGVEVEYIYRNYIEINNYIKNDEFKVKEDSNSKSIRYSLGIQPLDTNTIPEYANLEENMNTGVTNIRNVAIAVFSEINKIITGDLSINNISTSKSFDILLSSLDNANSENFEKASGIIQTFICVFTLLTCRIPNSSVPEEIWRLLFLIVIRLTPKSTKGYYFDSGRKITIFISLLRSLGIAFCTGYSEYSELFYKLLEELRIETDYRIPKLIIKEECEEFSQEDEDTVRFFRDLVDLT